MTTPTCNTIFVGDIPRYDKYIDGKNIKPADTQFRVDPELVLYFDKVPKKLEDYLKYSKYPIHIHLHDVSKIPKELKGKFEIVNNCKTITPVQLVQNIFYNPNRQQVYDLLVFNNPPVVLIHGWIKQNALRIWGHIPEALLVADEYVVNMLSPTYYFALVAHGTQNTTKVKKLKWQKSDK